MMIVWQVMSGPRLDPAWGFNMGSHHIQGEIIVFKIGLPSSRNSGGRNGVRTESDFRKFGLQTPGKEWA